MKIVEGFETARAVLSRETVSGSFAVSTSLRRSLQETFGTGDPEQAVRQIIDDVRSRGDAALRELTLRLDGVEVDSWEVPRDEITRAYDCVDAELLAALKLAAERIRDFHQAQKDAIWHGVSLKGLGQSIRPLQRVGFYVPGGTAAYPSTLLMTVIPARVASVGEAIMLTPPKKDGIPPVTLVAADIAGIDRIFRVGGAQAIAAMAFGTETVPAVDKICGPGNIFVMLAKKAVFGTVDIDALQGPSDVLIIADDNSNPEYCAADLLAQAEHDPLAEAHMVTTSRQLADEVNRAVARQVMGLSRKSIIEESLARGVIAVVASLDEAVNLANLYAPEHLCIMLENASGVVDGIKNAGCIFTGRAATVTLGDYVAGPSHALPTGGTARFGSPLNIYDFVKFINRIDIDGLDVKQLGEAASIIARAEGLDAHARAIEMRLKDIE